METEFLFGELDWVWDFAHNVNRTLLAQNDQGESRISKVYFFLRKITNEQENKLSGWIEPALACGNGSFV